MVSSRLPRSLEPNALARAIEGRRRGGGSIIDLTESNPTRSGLPYPRDLLAPLGAAGDVDYDPQPLGLWSARAAVAADFRRRGIVVSADRVALTSSTSEAYSLLFKLLCDAGDQVLVPHPSYPLFEHLTRLECVEAVPYALEYHGSWRIDIESVRRALAGTWPEGSWQPMPERNLRRDPFCPAPFPRGPGGNLGSEAAPTPSRPLRISRPQGPA